MKLERFSFLLMILLFAILSCEKENEGKDNQLDNTNKNHFVYDNQEYLLEKGIVEHYGNNHFVISLITPGLDIVRNGDYFDSITGNGNAIFFEIYTDNTEMISDGIYNFDKDETGDEFTLGYGKLALNWNVSEPYSDEYYFTSGSIQLDNINTISTITWQGVDEKGKEISGFFKGELESFNEIKDSISDNINRVNILDTIIGFSGIPIDYEEKHYDLDIDLDSLTDVTFTVSMDPDYKNSISIVSIKTLNNFEFAVQESYEIRESNFNPDEELIIDSILVEIPKIFELYDTISNLLTYDSTLTRLAYYQNWTYNGYYGKSYIIGWRNAGVKYIGIRNTVNDIFCWLKIEVTGSTMITVSSYLYNMDEEYLIIEE